MKKYTKPCLEIEVFASFDLITTSLIVEDSGDSNDEISFGDLK